MKKMSGNDFLVVRNNYEVKIISIEEHAILGNAKDNLVAQLDIAAIDLVTSKIANKKELLSLLIDKGLAKSEYDDVYIVHCCKETKNDHNNSKRKISFLEIIYEDDLENDDIYMLKDIANKRLFGESKVIDFSNKKINYYANKLIKRVCPDARESSDAFSNSGALLSRIRDVDLRISWSLKSYITSKTIYEKQKKQEDIVKRLCNYRTLRDIVMVEKKYRHEQEKDFFTFPNTRVNNMRMEAKYPLLVFVANKTSEYKNFDLGKLYTEAEFNLLRKEKIVNITSDISIINSEQIKMDNLSMTRNSLGIESKDLNGYIDMSEYEELKKDNDISNNDEEIFFKFELDDELFLCDDFKKQSHAIETTSIEEDDELLLSDDLKKTSPSIEVTPIEEDDLFLLDDFEEPFSYYDTDDLTNEERLAIASTQKRL